jgi:IS5 family transposase
MKPQDNKIKNLELFGILLEKFINKNHELVGLSNKIDWQRLYNHFGKFYKDFGRPGVSMRLALGIQLLKHIYNLSDEEVCRRWVENPYFQYFCGEIYFRHELPMERSSMSHFREGVGAESLEKLLEESLSVAYQIGAIGVKNLEKVVVDTTVQPKAVEYPTDSKLLAKAIEKLGKLAKAEGIDLRQSYKRVSKNMLHKNRKRLRKL